MRPNRPSNGGMPHGFPFTPLIGGTPQPTMPPTPETSRLFMPLHDLVLLEKKAYQSVEGIEIPEEYRDKVEETAYVVALGDGYLTDSGVMTALNLKIGDEVFLGNNQGHPVKVAGRNMILMPYRHILGKYPKPETQA